MIPTTQLWPDDLLDLVAAVEHLVARQTEDRPLITGLMDQDAAQVRDWLDQRGVSVTDPDALLAGVAFAVLFTSRMDRYARTVGCVTSMQLARAVRNGLVAALLDHLPPEARRWTAP